MSIPVVVAKGHGTGNDFVLLIDPEGDIDLRPDAVALLCDRRFGLGGDGVLRVVRTERVTSNDQPGGPWGPSSPQWFMDYRNADGSLSEMCGNGIRVFARYLRQRGWIPAGRSAIATRGGAMVVDVPDGDGDISVVMGRADVTAYPEQVTISVAGREVTARAMNLPNPHAVAFVDTLDQLPTVLPTPVLPPDVFPAGANVEFVEITDSHGHTARMRVFERGVGETLSCGTGACAAAVAVVEATGAAQGDVEMTVPGGRLHIAIGSDGAVTLTGPAVIVAEGTLEPSWWASV